MTPRKKVTKQRYKRKTAIPKKKYQEFVDPRVANFDQGLLSFGAITDHRWASNEFNNRLWTVTCDDGKKSIYDIDQIQAALDLYTKNRHLDAVRSQREDDGDAPSTIVTNTSRRESYESDIATEGEECIACSVCAGTYPETAFKIE
jgi:hypothetical protein